MKNVQKKITKDFFNKVAGEWFERTYDPAGDYLKFPVNKSRKDVALLEIDGLNLPKSALAMDIGCGTGQLVIDLIGRGYNAHGIDIADKMIAEAKEHLSEAKIKNKGVFRISDLADLSKGDKRYSLVTALGLLEYLATDEELFFVLKKIVNRNGYALVECRNRLFNLFSGNKYTIDICQSGQLKNLVSSFDHVENFSPIPISETPKLQKKVFSEISQFLNGPSNYEDWKKTTKKEYSKYPFTMVRRQHTPQELDFTANEFGFKLEYVVYYHLHPYLPRYEEFFPKIYNKISEIMTPLGRTSLGASSGSAFVGVLKKK
ncbi:MAG: methyltransferase domain-containing protein [Patescibacteria group bacterium]